MLRWLHDIGDIQGRIGVTTLALWHLIHSHTNTLKQLNICLYLRQCYLYKSMFCTPFPGGGRDIRDVPQNRTTNEGGGHHGSQRRGRHQQSPQQQHGLHQGRSAPS